MPRPFLFKFREWLADHVGFQYPQQRLEPREPGTNWRVFFREFSRELVPVLGFAYALFVSFCRTMGDKRKRGPFIAFCILLGIVGDKVVTIIL